MRRKRVRLAVAVAALILLAIWAASVDVPRLGGVVKGDEATYIAMAFSLAKDGDLKYRPEDLRRFYALYRQGPEGIFLKRTYHLTWRFQAGWPPIQIEKTPVPATEELSFGKPLAYAIVAASFAAIFGLGGLLLLNVLLLLVCLWCAVTFCQVRAGRIAGAVIGTAFLAASVVPVYGAWLTPEIFNVTLVFLAYFLWIYKRVASTAPRWLRWRGLDVVSAILLGVATFSKPPNALLIAPIVFSAIVERRWRMAILASMMFGLVAGGLFGVNKLITGDASYQGGAEGDRKSFDTYFPFDAAGTMFDSPTSGANMSTNEANDRNILAPSVMLPLLWYNVRYFFFGRDAGLVPYFFPGVVVLVLWLAHWRRSTPWQWAIALACAASALGLLVLAPASWNGGGGPIGNRYFLPIYPALLFLLPDGTSVVAGVVSAVVGVTFLWSLLLHPFAASQRVWLNPEHWPLRLLPVELTMMNDLPVFLNNQRGHVEVNKDPEVLLYYMDSNTYFQEANGFWVAPGATDIVIRTERPLSRLELRLMSRVPNTIDVSIGGRSERVTLRPNEETTIQLSPAPGVYAHDSYQTVLHLDTANGFHPQEIDPRSTDTRHLGVFVRPKYEVR